VLSAPTLAPILELQAGVTDDGSDAHAVTPRQALAGHSPDPVGVRLDTLIVGVRRQCVAAVIDEIQCPLPLAVTQLTERPGAADFREQFVRPKATAQGHADQMLDQHVQAQARRAARFDMAGGQGRPGGGSLHQLQAMGGHQGDA